MMLTLLRVNWLQLKRDYIGLGLTFILPIIFFSIFASIFANMGGGGGGESGPMSQAIKVIVVDLDQSDISRRFIMALDAQDGLEVLATPEETPEGTETKPYTRDQAINAVYGPDIPAALIIPAGFGDALGNFGSTAASSVELLYDPSNQFAQYAVSGLVQKAAFETVPEGNPAEEVSGPVLVQATNVRTIPEQGEDDDEEPASVQPMAAYYAAGIGVMFLLFSMAGAAGSILKEQETGALDRVLSSNITMTGLLTSKWLFYGIVGALQVTVMFIWAALFFDLELFTFTHIIGFIIMTIVTAAAAAAFGMMMATLCKSRGQLDGMSAIVVLLMSAIGGSMVPRMFMPPVMQAVGRYTFNGQALDGYLSVFWYTRSQTLGSVLVDIAFPVAALIGMTLAFLAVSRLMARRWDVT